MTRPEALTSGSSVEESKSSVEEHASENQPLPTLSDWAGLIRFSHTIFALPFALLATAMAFSTPLADESYPTLQLRDLVGILLCMVTARSAAMAFNRLVDHYIDAKNPRTATRHLPAGKMTRRQVTGFVIFSSVAFVASTLLFLPNVAPLAGALPVLAFLLGYSLAKRFTSAAHVWLGVALSLSPICAWVAIRGYDPSNFPSDLILPMVLACAVATWVAGFDIIYACQDADFDRETGLHSIPAKLGVAGALRLAAAFHLVMIAMLGLLAYVGSIAGLGWLFGSAVAVSAALVIVQHRLVRPDDLSRVNQAFFNTNAAISLVLLLAGIVDVLWVS